jgi:hypothetical protein
VTLVPLGTRIVPVRQLANGQYGGPARY